MRASRPPPASAHTLARAPVVVVVPGGVNKVQVASRRVEWWPDNVKVMWSYKVVRSRSRNFQPLCGKVGDWAGIRKSGLPEQRKQKGDLGNQVPPPSL